MMDDTSNSLTGRSLVRLVAARGWGIDLVNPNRRVSVDAGRRLATKPVTRPASAMTNNTRASGVMSSVGCSPPKGSADASDRGGSQCSFVTFWKWAIAS